MDAPVGVSEEGAGDAELLYIPHHAQSIPARKVTGNPSARKGGTGIPACLFITPNDQAARRPRAPALTAATADSTLPSTVRRSARTRRHHGSQRKTNTECHNPHRSRRLVLPRLGRLRLPAAPQRLPRSDVSRRIF